MNERQVITVSQLNRYMKSLIEGDAALASVWVRGELSNFTNHYKTGHMYMTVKDEGAAIRAVMFARDAAKLRFMPENGMKVLVQGRVAVYERDGQYQLYLREMEPDGVGALYLAFEQLKRKLGEEGLFDESRKRPIPKLPLKIGVITSPTGAAVRDVIHVLGRRFPLAEVLLYPVLVQGENAPPQLIEALKYFSDTGEADLVILGRGGGSIEELWAFNDEGVARAIAACKVPVISAVGHETDFTIADFAADLRAPTPSAAAELSVPDTMTLKTRFANLDARLLALVRTRLQSARAKVADLASRRVFKSPAIYIDDRRMAVVAMTARLDAAMRLQGARRRHRLEVAAGKLGALSPLAVLGRGYSVILREGAAVRARTELSPGDKIEIMLAKGGANATVTEVYDGK
ncbi:MAG TPA: exodeoxyribonuclease VII large subunit [Candidatus Acidoferrum sp.]|nr:exodeoxyribonuclease VII large subunit [Candidatus Acidoferrum sp.]